MQIINYIILAIIGIAFVVLSIAFLLLIAKNMKQGGIARKHLAKRVESMRMSRMLRALRLNLDQYLNYVPLVKIKHSMYQCENCTAIEQCDQKLEEGNLGFKDIDFCPNQACLKHFHHLKDSNS